jgi:hypothetical protein
MARSEPVGPPGLEPGTYGLKVRYSAIELRPLRSHDLREPTGRKRTESGAAPARGRTLAPRQRRHMSRISVLSGNIRLVETAFYEQVGADSYVATSATIGPWSANAQHGGPPSALAARAIERHEPDPKQRLARVCIDILRPIPIGKLTIRTRTVRPGRRVTLVEAVLEADGQDVLHARGWRIERPAGGVPEINEGGRPATLPPADDGTPPDIFGRQGDGYLTMIDWRFRADEYDSVKQGPDGRQAQVRSAWTRPRIPLLPGEDASPMCRTLLVADSGSGVSAALPVSDFTFVNVDLTVISRRDPIGEWLLLESSTVIGADGTGLASTVLSDQQGSFGRGIQTLIVAPIAQS